MKNFLIKKLRRLGLYKRIYFVSNMKGLQKAIDLSDYGDEINLLSGIYRFRKPIEFKSNTHLCGKGRERTKLK